MKRALKSPLALAILLTVIAGPVFAGNYAEGDPRPAPLSASASRAAVAADTQRWLQTAPDQGYPQGNPRAVVDVSSNSRAAVQADTMIWMRSGLAAAQVGEAGADLSRPAYQRAAADYALRRASPEFAALVEDIKRQGMTATTGPVLKPGCKLNSRPPLRRSIAAAQCDRPLSKGRPHALPPAKR